MSIVPVVLLVAAGAYVVAGVSEATRNLWWFGFWFSYAFANFCWLKATNAL